MTDNIIDQLIKKPRVVFTGFDETPHADGKHRLIPRGDAERDRCVAAKFTPAEETKR